MEEIFKARIEELNLNSKDKEFILNNLEICYKMYWQGVRDTALSLKHLKQ